MREVGSTGETVTGLAGVRGRVVALLSLVRSGRVAQSQMDIFHGERPRDVRECGAGAALRAIRAKLHNFVQVH